jgi:PadR family transcriptional regulator, regulatory protein PadR
MMNSNIDLEDVLDLVMMEEPKPTREALERWSKRFPHYRERLARFFAAWAGIAAEKEPVAMDAERIAAEAVRRVLEMKRQRQATPPEVPPDPLNEFDQYVLAAIYLLRGDAWTGSIVAKVKEMTGKEVSFASVRSSLNTFLNRGLVLERLAHRADKPKGMERRFYTATHSCEWALAHAREVSDEVADLLPAFARKRI